jgi:O-antigen ligase
VQLAPLGLFAIIVVFRVFFSDDLLSALESLFATDGLLFVLFLSLLVIAPSMQSEYDRSFVFSLALAFCLILARLYMAVVPISEVVEAFFWSGVVSVIVFVPLAFGSLMESIRTLSRFTIFSFHPNLLAFLLAGYFCAMVWKFLAVGWLYRVIAAPVGIICLVVIFFASSRGAIAGIVGGCALIAGMYIVHLPKHRRSRALKVAVLVVMAIVVTFVFLQSSEWVDNTYAVVDTVLSINDPNRGVDSGFTGRFDKWQETINTLKDGTWLIGHGIRSSDSMTQLIDNSYIVNLYEIGIFPLILICWRFGGTLWRFMKDYATAADSRQAQMFLACSFLMGTFLLSNFVARYLFAMGNPYSLLALLFFVAPTAHVARLRDTCPTQAPQYLRDTRLTG